MSDISTDAMMREAAMMDASDNHVWARKTRRLCIERDKLRAQTEAAEARVKELEEVLQRIASEYSREWQAGRWARAALPAVQPAPEAAALAEQIDIDAAIDAAQAWDRAQGNVVGDWRADMTDAEKDRLRGIFRAALAAMEGRG